jgi:hypothetical protein
MCFAGCSDKGRSSHSVQTRFQGAGAERLRQRWLLLVLSPRSALWRRVRPQEEGLEVEVDRVLLAQPFDPLQADVAPGSYVVVPDHDIYWFNVHGSPSWTDLVQATFSRLTVQLRERGAENVLSFEFGSSNV